MAKSRKIASKGKKSNKCSSLHCRNPRAPRRSICHKCHSRRLKEKNYILYTFNALRNNARRRGKPFELDLLGFKLFCKKHNYLELKGRTAQSLSIDRIDVTKGYTFDNIQVLTVSQNTHKRNRQEYALGIHSQDRVISESTEPIIVPTEVIPLDQAPVITQRTGTDPF